MLEHYSEARERYEFQMGPVRGKLATALDILTDALTLVGQHGVYCRSQRQPQFPSIDVRLILQQIEDSKGLVIEAMTVLRNPGKIHEKVFDMAAPPLPNEGHA